jgi:hypothetical protein
MPNWAPRGQMQVWALSQGSKQKGFGEELWWSSYTLLLMLHLLCFLLNLLITQRPFFPGFCTPSPPGKSVSLVLTIHLKHYMWGRAQASHIFKYTAKMRTTVALHSPCQGSSCQLEPLFPRHYLNLKFQRCPSPHSPTAVQWE